MKLRLSPTPAYQRAPDMSRVNQTILEGSDRQMVPLVYKQALAACPDLKTVGVYHQPAPAPEHLFGATPSFSNGRHSVHVTLHGEGPEPSKEIISRRPIIGELSEAWLDTYASEQQALALAESLSFAIELGRASLQVSFNGRPGEYYEFLDMGLDLLPFRQSSLDQIADPQNIALVAAEPKYFEEKFNTTDWNGLAYKHYEGYRKLPREQYVENFVAYVALQVDQVLDPSQRETWGLSNLRYTSGNGAAQGTS